MNQQTHSPLPLVPKEPINEIIAEYFGDDQGGACKAQAAVFSVHSRVYMPREAALLKRVAELEEDSKRLMVITTAEWVSSPTQMDKDWRIHVRLPLQKAQTTACGKTLIEAADRAVKWFAGYGVSVRPLPPAKG